MTGQDQFAGYRLEGLLGEGSVGTVFRAYDPRTDRRVALKVLKQVWRGEEAVVRRFLDEAKKNGPLSHAHIVRIHRVDEEPCPFIDMELVEGPTLADHARARGRVPPEEVARIGRDLASALDHAHRLSRVHRDVKPSNVMMADEGRVPRLVDFGIAMIDRPEAVRLTRHGELVGTPRYMAPEQVAGERVDGRTDLYALGAVLYELLAGRPAVLGDGLAAMKRQIIDEHPPSLQAVAPGTPPRLAAAVERLMAKDPGARFASAREAMTALEASMARHHPPSGRSVRRPEPMRRAPRRIPILAGALAAALVLGAVAFLLLLPPSLPDQPPIAAADAAVTMADTPTIIAVLANDSDPEGRQLALVGASARRVGEGSVRVAGDALAYDPAGAFAALPAGQAALVNLAYTVRDEAGGLGQGEVVVTVRARATAVAATSQVPPPAPPPLPSDPQQALAQAARATREAPCARLEAEAAGDRLRVMLAASDPEVATRIAGGLRQASGPGAVDLQVDALPAQAIACGVFALLHRATTSAAPRFVHLQRPADGACNGPDPVRCYSGVETGLLAAGEQLVLAVDPPAGTRHLLVDYFMADGSVAHLFPPLRDGEDRIEADRYAIALPAAPVIIGDSRAGEADLNEYPVGEPFGHELVVVLATSAPLFAEGRAYLEPAADYLAALAAKLALAGTAEAQASTLWLETVETHR